MRASTPISISFFFNHTREFKENDRGKCNGDMNFPSVSSFSTTPEIEEGAMRAKFTISAAGKPIWINFSLVQYIKEGKNPSGTRIYFGPEEFIRVEESLEEVGGALEEWLSAGARARV